MSIVDAVRAHAAKRPCLEIDLRDVMGLETSARVALVVLPVGLVDEATEAAYQYRSRTLKGLADNARGFFAEDSSIVEDAKIVEILVRACRCVDDRTKQAFPSADFMRSALSGEEIAALWRLYRNHELALSRPSSTEQERTVLKQVIAASSKPDILVRSLSTEVLTDLVTDSVIASHEASKR
jgi:hypothetical protein